MKEEKNYFENVYAKDVTGKICYIGAVESGRKGYFCLDCDREMQAKKGAIRFHHFAHDPKDVINKGRCTFSDETYRHKLAKETLQRIKSIKAPALIKYPDQYTEGPGYLLQPSRTIHATSVEIEISFYEDSTGKILWGRNQDLESSQEKFLLIRPDVTFFDTKGNPILFIELVATHKIKPDKYFRIRNLGIDTLQVNIPKGSPQEIEDSFFTTTSTKWIYNAQKEHTPYKFVSTGDSKGISSIDEFEQGLRQSGKSFACRAFEISEALRRIRKNLESQQFRDAQQKVGSELQRVEINTKRDQQRLFDIQDRVSEEIIEQFREQEETLGKEEKEFDRETERFQSYTEGLEDRYFSEAERIESARTGYRCPMQSEIDRLEGELREQGAATDSLQQRLDKLESAESEYAFGIESNKTDLNERTRELQATSREIEQRRADLPAEFERFKSGLRKKFEQLESDLRVGYEKYEKDLRDEFDRLGKQSIEAINGRDPRRAPRMHARIKGTIDSGRLLDSIPEAEDLNRRMRNARKEFEKGSFKNWI